MKPNHELGKRAKRSPATPEPKAPDPSDPTHAPPHAPFLDDDSASVLEHGERGKRAAREDALVGTSSSHGAALDKRAEEPSAEISTRASTEGDGV